MIAEVEVEWDESDDVEAEVTEFINEHLDPEKVREARAEEVGYMTKKKLWREVDIQECWDRTGRAPVTVKWVDVLKAADGETFVRSRLVARDFKVKGEKDREDLFAATPPLELLRMMVSKAATVTKKGTFQKLLFIDAKKAHLNPKCDQDVYFWLPDEANPTEGKCGKLDFWLYGFRPAAQAWETHYAKMMVEAGFRRGSAAPVAFWHPERDLACVVHGDDFILTGEDEDLDWIEALMHSWFEIKVRARLGGDEKDDKEVVVLGRVVTWRSWGYEYQADPKHRNILLEKFGLGGNSKGLTVTGKPYEEEELNEEVLAGPEASEFRARAARANFMSQDCPDVQYATKEICREMSAPTEGSWARLKHLVRYLLMREKAVYRYEWLYEEPSLDQYSDSDWAGCRRTRKSTTGGVSMRGPHCLKTWSATQGPIALSSAEAEYYAMVDNTMKAMGIKTMAEEIGIFGMSGPVVLHTDSSSAKSFASRRGLGKARHVQTRCLWLQQAVADRQVLVRKVAGTRNPADILTKYLSRELAYQMAELMSVQLVWRPRA